MHVRAGTRLKPRPCFWMNFLSLSLFRYNISIFSSSLSIYSRFVLLEIQGVLVGAYGSLISAPRMENLQICTIMSLFLYSLRYCLSVYLFILII